jgi:hypothetical protein
MMSALGAAASAASNLFSATAVENMSTNGPASDANVPAPAHASAPALAATATMTPSAAATTPAMNKTSGNDARSPTPTTATDVAPTNSDRPSSPVPASDAGGRTAAQTLQAQIDALAEVASRVRALRQAPASLLRAGGAGVQFDVASAARTGFGVVAHARARIVGEDIQHALGAAAASERGGRAGVRGGMRRDVRKRRYVDSYPFLSCPWRVCLRLCLPSSPSPRAPRMRTGSCRVSPTPESPKPFVLPRARSVFPAVHSPPAPLATSGLPEFIRTFNAAQRAHSRKISLHICVDSAIAPRAADEPPVLLRFAIADVLKAYLTLGVPSAVAFGDGNKPPRERGLLIENIAVFGSREKVRLYSPSLSRSRPSVYTKASHAARGCCSRRPRRSASAPLPVLFLRFPANVSGNCADDPGRAPRPASRSYGGSLRRRMTRRLRR